MKSAESTDTGNGSRIIFQLTLILLLVSCTFEEHHHYGETAAGTTSLPGLSFTPAKWLNDTRGVVSLQYDAAFRHDSVKSAINELAIESEVSLDWEMVTANYDNTEDTYLIEELRDSLAALGIGVFGHGHQHLMHDTLTFAEAYTSFATCYELMDLWGLEPRGYGYPHNSGHLAQTQLALELAGFICGRGATWSRADWLNCPDDEMEPENYYYIYAVPVASELSGSGWVHNNDEMVEVFEDAVDHTAWVIIMYHGIGVPSSNYYYPLDEFAQDVEHLAANRSEIWSASMNTVICYIREREAFQSVQYHAGDEGDHYTYQIQFRDNLDNNTFNCPLTIHTAIDFEEEDLEFTAIEVQITDDSTLNVPVVDNQAVFNLVPDEMLRELKLYYQ